MSYTAISVKGENKARFDNIQRILACRNKKAVPQDEVLDILMSDWEAKNIKIEEE
jgi:hypothetical protein